MISFGFLKMIVRIQYVVIMLCFFQLILRQNVVAEDDRQSSVATSSDTTQTPVDIGGYRQLFVDDYLIDRLIDKAGKKMNAPVAREVVMEHDAWKEAIAIITAYLKTVTCTGCIMPAFIIMYRREK